MRANEGNIRSLEHMAQVAEAPHSHRPYAFCVARPAERLIESKLNSTGGTLPRLRHGQRPPRQRLRYFR